MTAKAEGDFSSTVLDSRILQTQKWGLVCSQLRNPIIFSKVTYVGKVKCA